MAAYRKAIQIKPDYAETHNNLGITLQYLGQLEEALASYREALAIKPDYIPAEKNLLLLDKTKKLVLFQLSLKQV